MRILAIDTSTMLGGIAILDDSTGLIMESRLNIRATHSERLMSEIDRALDKSGLGYDNIDSIAVTVGPGSFTGLRIGIGTVKGLAFATGIKTIAVPTLEAFAWSFPFSPYPVCPLLDARKKEVYAGAFMWEGGGFRRIINETPIDIGAFMDKIGSFEKCVFLGEGAVLYRERIIERLQDRAIFSPMHLNVPMPSATAVLGLEKALKGEFTPADTLAPAYIRKAEAELKNK